MTDPKACDTRREARVARIDHKGGSYKLNSGRNEPTSAIVLPGMRHDCEGSSAPETGGGHGLRSGVSPSTRLPTIPTEGGPYM
jgi:hypothetical protein